MSFQGNESLDLQAITLFLFYSLHTLSNLTSLYLIAQSLIHLHSFTHTLIDLIIEIHMTASLMHQKATYDLQFVQVYRHEKTQDLLATTSLQKLRSVDWRHLCQKKQSTTPLAAMEKAC